MTGNQMRQINYDNTQARRAAYNQKLPDTEAQKNNDSGVRARANARSAHAQHVRASTTPEILLPDKESLSKFTAKKAHTAGGA